MWQWQVRVCLWVIFHAEFGSVFNMRVLYNTWSTGCMTCRSWCEFHFQPGDRHRHVNTCVNLLWLRVSCNGAVLSLISPLIFKLTPVSQVIWANIPFQSWLSQVLEVACSWWWRNCEKTFDDYQHDYVISAYPYAVDWFQLDLNQNWTKHVLRHFGVSKISFSLMLYSNC